MDRFKIVDILSKIQRGRKIICILTPNRKLICGVYGHAYHMESNLLCGIYIDAYGDMWISLNNAYLALIKRGYLMCIHIQNVYSRHYSIIVHALYAPYVFLPSCNAAVYGVLKTYCERY